MQGVNIQKSYLKCQPLEATLSVRCAGALHQQCPHLCPQQLQELCSGTGCSEYV